MINEIQLENFKSFSALQKIPLKPITLIYGANSSGKSSILHSLAYFIELNRTSKTSIHEIPISNGKIVLGGIENYIHRNNFSENNEIQISIKLPIETNDSDSNAYWENDLIGNSCDINVKILPFYPSPDNLEVDKELNFTIDSELFISFVTNWGSPCLTINFNHPLFERIRFDSLEQKNKISEIINAQSSHIKVDIIKYYIDGVLINNFSLDVRNDHYFKYVKNPEKITRLSQELQDIFKDELSEKLNNLKYLDTQKDILDRINNLVTENLKAINNNITKNLIYETYVGPFRFYPERSEMVFFGREEFTAKKKHKLNYFHRLLNDKKLRDSVNNWCSLRKSIIPYQVEGRQYLAKKVAIDFFINNMDEISFLTHYKEELEKLKISEIYKFKELNSKGFEEFKIAFPNLVELIELASTIDSDMIFGSNANTKGSLFDFLLSSFETELLGSSDKIEELVLFNSSTNIYSSFRDLGVGISQMLPIIIESLRPEKSLVLIEEPEIHLHPALQAELGDLFISSTKTLNKQFLIETHSEHILLRIMRRIRETTNNSLPQDVVGLSADDVSVLYVYKDENGNSSVLRLRLDENGDFLDPWPGGFFEEGFNEMFS